ncbi:hypothetical protein [Salinarimonas soli]|uniref:Uncharacterized protein n=1 Tax=Salinarimonas soli TaxID=1638099 RepID=A0A5B2W037_9HYPH|nr:hypothetical protein [Salinarimonas soli]KAA2244050.1 hypothetical protein F0L46_02050 [Salinarimonas soli]
MLLIVLARATGTLGGWSGFDVMLAAALLLATCLIVEVAARTAPNRSYLAGVATALVAGVGLVVVNGAVGLIGAEDQVHNRVFLGVTLVALTIAALTRGRPPGMVRAMSAAALVHVALSAFLLGTAGSTGIEAVGLSVFAAFWLASAWLFRRSAVRAD